MLANEFVPPAPRARVPELVFLPFRTGLIGCGGIVQKTHLPCLTRLADEVEIIAVADPDPASRTVVGETARVPESARFANYPLMLESLALDVVLIATPHHLHVAPA